MSETKDKVTIGCVTFSPQTHNHEWCVGSGSSFEDGYEAGYKSGYAKGLLEGYAEARKERSKQDGWSTEEWKRVLGKEGEE